MADLRETVDRRRNKRFTPKETSFAVIDSAKSLIGQINNISKGGVLFQYVDEMKRISDVTTVDLFMTNSNFCLRNLKVKTISDNEAVNIQAYGAVPLRQHRAEFKELSYMQDLLMDYFLLKYTDADK